MSNGCGWLRQILTSTLPPISQSCLSESISPISASFLQQPLPPQHLNNTTTTTTTTPQHRHHDDGNTSHHSSHIIHHNTFGHLGTTRLLIVLGSLELVGTFSKIFTR
jgi:hypothetical protein